MYFKITIPCVVQIVLISSLFALFSLLMGDLQKYRICEAIRTILTNMPIFSKKE